MTLSLHERRVLADMERQFAREDPRLTGRLRAFALEEPARPTPAPPPHASPGARRLAVARVATLGAFLLILAFASRNVVPLVVAAGICLAGAVAEVSRRRARRASGERDRRGNP